MKIIVGILREFAGLFVEDLGYSMAIGLWIAAVAVVSHRVPMNSGWRGPVLFFGVVLLLLENVTRSARKKMRRAGPPVS